MLATLFRCALAPAGLLLIATPAAARPPCHSLFIASRSDWPPPLDRVIRFAASEVSLREALDRAAVIARVRLSYSSDGLPLDRTVCVSAEGAPLGAVLERLLAGLSIEAVPAGGDHVVLSPRAPLRVSMLLAPVVLDRIVVTGSASGAGQRRLPLALDVIDGRELERRRVFTLASALGGSAPGVWLWPQSPGSPLLRYGSIRGASSFGLSYPKTFIDGVEVAHPLLITRLAPETIESIELIRGPHGSTLYGADAISGVMNITTRTTDERRRPALGASLQSQAGMMGSDFVAHPALSTETVGTLGGGGATRSGRVTAEAGTDNAWIPGAYARRFSVSAGGRSVAEHSLLSATLRLSGQEARSPLSPVLDSVVPDSIARRLVRRTQPARAMQYTAGLTFRLLPGARWRHALTAGADGYSLDGLFDDGAPLPSAADSALRAARGDALRGTIRLSSTAMLGDPQGLGAQLTLTGDHSVLRQHTTSIARAGSGGPGPGMTQAIELTQWRSTTGASALASASLRERLFVNGGLRLERSSPQAVTLPMAGWSLVPLSGALTVKLRAAWGSGIRYPETVIREALHGRVRLTSTALALEPEKQSGVEGGADLIWARGLSLTVTRFDQRASGLIQSVIVPGDTASSGPGPRERVRYLLQNVGAIDNTGWEVQGTATRGAFSLTAALSLVDSRVRRLAQGYRGDLQPGDRMLEVPRRTLSLSASWAGAPWFASLTAWRAEDWINYDRIALTADFVADTSANAARNYTGAALRQYWRRYPGVTRLDAAFTWPFNHRFQASAIGQNLLGRQTGEPDNITVLPGRTVALSVRGVF